MPVHRREGVGAAMVTCGYFEGIHAACRVFDSVLRDEGIQTAPWLMKKVEDELAAHIEVLVKDKTLAARLSKAWRE